MQENWANLLMGLEGRFDGHAHVFRADLPMADGRRYSPDYHAPLSSYAPLLRSNDLDGALLVQPSFLGSDNSFLLETLAQARSDHADLVFRGVAVVEPTIDKSRIADLASADVVGMRLNLLGGRPFDEETWANALNYADEAGWHVELHIEGERLRTVLAPLLKYNQRIVIDHFGLPAPDLGKACPAIESILCAPSDRLFIKTSAPYRVFPNVNSNAAADFCAPYYRIFESALGGERLVWGSDWPWTRFEGRHDFAAANRWREEWNAMPF